jgi:hypothetical protein
MKKINFRKIGILLTIAFFLNSCEKWIDPEINVDPNAPADVNLNLLLPSSQAGLAYAFGGDHSRTSAMWMQHLSGVDRQSFALERYSVLESDNNNLWNTLYGGVLKNLVIMIDKGEEQGAIYYTAVAKILTAFTLGIITDVWNDAPFSDALRGEDGNLTAQFDTQEQLYNTMNSYLNDAIALLDQTSPTGVPVPGNDDLMYQGNTAKWMKLAKALKVRYALHLSNRTNDYSPVRALINEGGLMTEVADNFTFNFSTAANEWNPRYQFDSDRGDIRVGARIVNLMNATNDPRRPVYFDTKGAAEYVGSGPGEALTTAAWAGPGYASQGSPVFFFPYFEQLFIEAEVFFNNDNGRAAAAYNAGVMASLATHGISDPDWEAANAAETAGTITMEKIMTGKYIAMFLHSETWTDWRRTNIPSLTAPPAVTTATPRRYLYTTDEINYNGANVPTGQTATSRVWWDVP